MTTPSAVGIDVGLLEGRGLDLVALDGSRCIIKRVRHIHSLDLLTQIVEDLAPDVICIDSPSQWAYPGTRRPAERELTRRGINLYTTPSEDQAGPFHRWMQDGFRVFDALSPAYPRYTGASSSEKRQSTTHTRPRWRSWERSATSPTRSSPAGASWKSKGLTDQHSSGAIRSMRRLEHSQD